MEAKDIHIQEMLPIWAAFPVRQVFILFACPFQIITGYPAFNTTCL
jgi:hypothetical protein